MSGGTPPPGLLEIGRIGKPHGVRGDVLVSLTSDLEERHTPGAEFTIVVAGENRNLIIASSRPHKDRWVMHFEGVDDRNLAEKLTNKFLYAEPLESDEALWVHDLIGSTVVDLSGTTWGRCTSVIGNPAHDLVEIDGSVLVPMPFVISCKGGVTTIDPPDGLRELSTGDESGDDAD